MGVTPERRAGLAVGSAFGVQGLGYAAVVTALPAVKDRLDLGDAAVSLVLLGVCVAAALGSALADAVAVRAGSRAALRTGLAAQVVALLGITAAAHLPLFVVAVALYGVGIGTVDAATNMQGVALQGQVGRPVMGRLYAVYTVGGIVGALAATGAAGAGASAFVVLVGVAAAQAAVVVVGRRWLLAARAPAAQTPAVQAPAAASASLARREPLPRAGVWAVGALVLVAFVADAAVSSWSTVYLADGLDASDAHAPLGYAAYLAIVLVARLGADALTLRLGRRAVALAAVGLGAGGCALVAAGDTVALAVLGFAVAGVVAGLLVPIAFSQAGDVLPARSDEVIARVNVFNYAGAVLGAVAPGLLGGGSAIRFGFAAPAVALLLVLPVVLRLPSHRRPADAPVLAG